MITNNDTELIGTMGLLMLISNQDGILTIEPIVDQVKESFRGRRRLYAR